MNNKGAYQSVRMRRLICAFIFLASFLKLKATHVGYKLFSNILNIVYEC